ncbi:hypothetical protein DPMN_097456 [Dreissena polymorpha]|uniref:Uncharacterized protein n=1 Tax=Dreissena polymorpha TaxID=45954 RepID=A0A9D4R5R6_DREPO|nr:hypothetical protein DPMN_097456 [Dreissena polymorpha]
MFTKLGLCVSELKKSPHCDELKIACWLLPGNFRRRYGFRRDMRTVQSTEVRRSLRWNVALCGCHGNLPLETGRAAPAQTRQECTLCPRHCSRLVSMEE